MIDIHENIDIRRMTTFGLPAKCGRLIEYDTIDDLRQLFAENKLHDIMPIGGGSNLLFTTGHYGGTLLHCTGKAVTIGSTSEDGSVTIEADAGCLLDDLCRMSCDIGLWGLENLSGIPGEIGGAAVQNVGAYGTEFKDIVETVHCFDITSGETKRLDNSECRYGYRDSVFKHLARPGSLVVTKVSLQLSALAAPRLDYAALAARFSGIAPAELTPAMLRNAITHLRDSKLPSPASTGSAGSFFKNPVVTAELHMLMQQRLNRTIPGRILPSGDIKLSAAWLIDNAGCKQLKCGAAGVWEKQPLVIVNTDGTATGQDVVALENAIYNAVKGTFGVELTPEVVHI